MNQFKDSLHELVKVLVYAALAIVGMVIFAALLVPVAEYLAGAALSVFLAAVVSNALAMRIYEQRRLVDIGFAWNSAAVRNLLLGLAGGAGAALVVLGAPLVAGRAELVSTLNNPADWSKLLFVMVVLVFGAVGEEMLFRGFGFQVLLAKLGPFATILPVAVLFGFAHGSNPNLSRLGLANTIGWGVALGYAFWRSGDLWLPIGLHYGWNIVLPLLGAPLSGFKMGVTGYAMRWKTNSLWSGGDYGPEAGLLTTAVLSALLLYLWKAPVRRQTPYLLSRREA